MVITSIFTGTHLPVRSVSLPTRVELEPEPLLQSLKSFQGLSHNAKTTPFGLEEIQAALIGLAELYNSVGELVQSSSTQQALVHYKEGKLVEEALNESVVLIDSCSLARDIILIMKQNIQTLQSALRRKSANSSIEGHVCAYFSFRRKVKKDIRSCLAALKRMENDRTTNFSLLDIPNHDLLPLVRLLREARTISISIFGELLAFLSVPVGNGKARGWSLVSQLMPVIKSGSGKGQKTVNELENVDIALHSLLGQGKGNGGNDNKAEVVQMAQRRLGTLASSFERIESGLDCMFRCLVKHRVCFLNMLVH